MTFDDLILLDGKLTEFELSLSKLPSPTPEHWHILNRMDEILRQSKADFMAENGVKRSVDEVKCEPIMALNNG